MIGVVTNSRRAWQVFGLLFAVVLAARLCHSDIVWVEEGYPLAAAQQMLHGKALYRDVWFDKPPLSPAFYLLFGASTGVPLRLAGALFVLLTSVLAYGFGRDAWGEREGLLAACFLAFFLTFGIPAAVMALAPDLLLIAPHTVAMWLAWRQRPFLCGLACGIALLVHPKAVYILATCLLWSWRGWPLLFAGFALPPLLHVAYLQAIGALPAFWLQVYEWGFAYSRDTFLAHPIREGLLRSANWFGMQAALTAGAVCFAWRSQWRQEWRWCAWLLLSAASVCAGWRFFPRYYFQLLPVMALLAARGITLLGRRGWLALLLLVIPLARFGPRYVQLANDERLGRPHQWSDLAMADDTQRAAALIKKRNAPDLFVWGYRPDLYPLTGMRAGTRFLDSQPLTGVLADRHLLSAQPTEPILAERNRKELVQTQPAIIVDGLGPYNPALAIEAFPDLRLWLLQYRLVEDTGHSRIYVRKRPNSEK